MRPKDYYNVEIQICTHCKGSGTIEHKSLSDYHNGIYEYFYNVCGDCKGSGRLHVTEKTTITKTPYTNPELEKIVFEKLKE